MQTQNITLDFCRNDYKTITVKQYDKDSRNLLITCTDNGVVYKLDSSTQECNVKMNTPDNRAIYNAATINEDGKVFITFDENMVYDSGTGQLEIHIIEQSTKRTLSSMILTVIIVGSVYSDDKIIASDEFNALTEVLLGIGDVTEDANTAADRANAAADAALLAASTIASMFVPLTQAEYDALVEAGTVDSSKYYMIVEDNE